MKNEIMKLEKTLTKEREIRDLRKKEESDLLFRFAKDALLDFELKIQGRITSDVKMYYITAACLKMESMLHMYCQKEDGDLRIWLWGIAMEAFESVYEMRKNPENYEKPNMPIRQETFDFLFSLDKKLFNLTFTADGKFNPSNMVAKELTYINGCLAFKMLLNMIETTYIHADLLARSEK